jgi:hypothetical protein
MHPAYFLKFWLQMIRCRSASKFASGPEAASDQGLAGGHSKECSSAIFDDGVSSRAATPFAGLYMTQVVYHGLHRMGLESSMSMMWIWQCVVNI